jgi:choice-of-anchor B domain-containing protein
MTEEERERLNQLAGGNAVVASTAPPLNVSLMSQVRPQQFSTNSTCLINSTNVCANDVWAYVSPAGREYAILGLRNGTGFVDITDPYNPAIVGAISDSPSVWSDMKTYGAYAYNVNEAGGGMQVISLAQIDPPTQQVSLLGALTQNGLARSHTLAMNEASGFVYLCGSNLGGRLVAASLANPAAPTIAGSMNEGVYVHAAQVVTYTTGPYAGREIAFCYCGGFGLKIVDVTNKANMFTMSTLIYPTLDYCHQGELTSDWRHVVIDDEFDEDSGLVPTTTTYVANVENLSSPYLVTSFTNGQPAIDHNQMVRGDFTFQANYTTGLRVYNISDVNNAQEVGYYDTYPYNDSKSMNGAWGVHATLPSGSILLSDMVGGLFVFDVSEILGPSCPPPAPPEVSPTYAARNRYLTMTPAEPGVKTALRVTLVDMPPPFEGLEGTHRWVDEPIAVQDATVPPTAYMVAQLRCTPRFIDWGTLGVVHIADEAIVPGGRYRIDAIRGLCARSVAANFSPPSPDIPTSLVWADIVGNDTAMPDGQVNALDVVAIVNKFRQEPGAPSLLEADLFPAQPDQVVNALDVTVSVDAFRGLGYPFPGPAPCP